MRCRWRPLQRGLAILIYLWIRGSKQERHLRSSRHLHQTVIPVQGYVQLRPHHTTLPSFGGGPPATPKTANETIPTEVAIREGGGKASPSVSIFSRAPLCPNTCRHCRNKPCDIATDHDDHICYNCEQRLLFPERIP